MTPPGTASAERVVYEIVNPSDACTIAATEPLVATLACLALGGGAYALRPDPGCPMFMFGGDPDEWAREEHGHPIAELWDLHAAAIADCLQSFVYGGERARLDFEAAMAAIEADEAREAFREEWFDRRRSSLNDIGARAAALARSFRDRSKGRG